MWQSEDMMETILIEMHPLSGIFMTLPYYTLLSLVEYTKKCPYTLFFYAMSS